MVRRRLVMLLAVACPLAFAGAPAHAGDPSRDLGDVKSSESRDLDAKAQARDLDQAVGRGAQDMGEEVDPVDLDHADDARAHELDSDGATEGKDLREADVAPEWEPPPCEDVQLEMGPPAEASDTTAWSAELDQARADADKARAALAAADTDYTYARNRKKPRGAALQKIVAARDKARQDVSTTRCKVPALVERARKAGVAPEVWRDHPASAQ